MFGACLAARSSAWPVLHNTLAVYRLLCIAARSTAPPQPTATPQVCLLPTAKVMFAATESGALRTYKYPLTGEFLEIKTHHSAITRLRMSWDEQLLVSASDDGCVFVYDVKDKDAKAAARRWV